MSVWQLKQDWAWYSVVSLFYYFITSKLQLSTRLIPTQVVLFPSKSLSFILWPWNIISFIFTPSFHFVIGLKHYMLSFYFNSKQILRWASWYISPIPALNTKRREDSEFEANQSNTVRICQKKKKQRRGEEGMDRGLVANSSLPLGNNFSQTSLKISLEGLCKFALNDVRTTHWTASQTSC